MMFRTSLFCAVVFIAAAGPLAAQTTASSSPSPSPSPTASASTASPSPAASASPVPQTITPPPSWKPVKFVMQFGPMTSDSMWASAGKGAVFTMHADTFGMKDVAQYAAGMRKGLELIGGHNSVVAFKAMNVCAGKQKGWYAEVHLTQGEQNIVEKMTMALTDRVYVAEYVRAAATQDDPAAIASIMSLCAP